MADISAQQVRELREKTGAGMLDCKKALTENEGDLEAAIDWLRKKGLSAVSKKAGRVAAEGIVGAITEKTWGALLEVNAETDFVARNEQFQQFVAKLLGFVHADRTLVPEHAESDEKSIERLRAAHLVAGTTVEEDLAQLAATIGESLRLRRLKGLCVTEGVVTSYVHSALAPGLGKIGVLVALESQADTEKLQTLGRQIAMHVAAAKPICLAISDVPVETLEREKEILVEQARASGRPDAVIEKMVEGRLRKFYEDMVLLEQVFVVDGKRRVADVLADAAKEWGTPVVLKDFSRMTLGEGIEKPQTDFAAEVQAQAGQI